MSILFFWYSRMRATGVAHEICLMSMAMMSQDGCSSILLDSAPRRMLRGKKNGKITSSKGSRAGVHYVAANDARIKNEGEAKFHFTTKEGHAECFTFQIADVNKALCAVSYLVDHGYQVIFDKDEDTLSLIHI